MHKITISDAEFIRFQSFLKSNSGISLVGNKKYLIINRLRPVLDMAELDSLCDIISLVEANPTGNLASVVIDAMTTNETFWFRDNNQFRLLENKLYAELFSKNTTVNIWSAASSTGQEPYSISLSAESFLNARPKEYFLRITATDISNKMIARAKRGVYSDFELERGLPVMLKSEHFLSVNNGWLISARHRARVSYFTLNLLEDFQCLGCFDIIFCRNVLMYFSNTTQLDILNRIQAALNPGGYLFLSNTERLPSGAQGFEVLRNMGVQYYRKT